MNCLTVECCQCRIREDNGVRSNGPTALRRNTVTAMALTNRANVQIF